MINYCYLGKTQYLTIPFQQTKENFEDKKQCRIRKGILLKLIREIETTVISLTRIALKGANEITSEEKKVIKRFHVNLETYLLNPSFKID